jgi:hypothetical protein
VKHEPVAPHRLRPVRLLSAVILSVSVASMIFTYAVPRWFPVAIDFAYYWKAVRRADPYRISEYFVNPPPMLIALQPLRLVGFFPGFIIWAVISLLAFFFAARRLVGDRAALLSLLSAPFVQGMLLGQSAMMLAAAVLLAVSLPSLWCGVVLGCVAAMKPQLMIAAPFVLLFKRDWRALAGMVAGGFALALLSLAAFGLGTWLAWLHAIGGFYDAVLAFKITVITPAAVGSSLGLPMWAGLSVGVALAAILIGRFAHRAEGANLAALMIAASVLVSPYALVHDLCGTIPAAVALVLSGPAMADLAVALATLALLCLIPATFTVSGAYATLWIRERAVGSARRRG